MSGRSVGDRQTRRRLFGLLFIGAGLNRTAVLILVAVTGLLAKDLLGSARWSGLPIAVFTIGVAIGTTPLAAFMTRTGRRPGMVLGLATASAGAVIAVFAAAVRSFSLFLIAMLILGLGNAADRLSRYAAADLATEDRSGSAIGAIVWAGTIGSVLGPSLLRPGARLGESLGLPGLSGPYIITAGLLAVSSVLMFMFLRPDPLKFARAREGWDEGHVVTTSQIGAAFRRPTVRYAAMSLIVGQFVMVIIMAMTPVHIRMAGGDLGLVGLVISVHTLGMFALSPVSGWLADRFGPVPTIVTGQVMLVVSTVMAIPAGGNDRGLLVASLFLLGLGWNFGFVAGSALVTHGMTGALRLRVQGVADTMVWGSGAVAAASSGVILDWAGFARLALIGAVVSVLALAARARYRTTESVTV